ncbi:MAG: UDP-N-acetylmuramate dehydrogenase [Candidatus Margulisiibacteriota bacterium]
MDLKKNKPLKNLTTFRIGGPAKYFVAASDLQELKDALAFAKKNKLPVFALGAGSNILVSDRGFPGLVIKLVGDFRGLDISGIKITAGAGLRVSELLRTACSNSLSGLEFMTGIPGTVGGAVVMNAGVGKAAIGHLISWVDVLDGKGKRHRLRQKDLEFGYRRSILRKRKYVVIEAGFKALKKSNSEEIRKRMNGLMKKRLESQPYNRPSAGSFFKNPAGQQAWQLIDGAGLRGARVGDAEVSKKHANFIINRKNARAEDVLALATKVRNKVKKLSQVSLQPEVIIVSPTH